MSTVQILFEEIRDSQKKERLLALAAFDTLRL